MQTKKISYFLVVSVAAIMLSACKQAVQFDQPPDIRYGEDVCDACNMII